MLLVGDTSTGSMEFPVYTVLLSGLSEILQDVIQHLAPADPVQPALPRLPMHGDQPAAVEAAACTCSLLTQRVADGSQTQQTTCIFLK